MALGDVNLAGNAIAMSTPEDPAESLEAIDASGRIVALQARSAGSLASAVPAIRGEKPGLAEAGYNILWLGSSIPAGDWLGRGRGWCDSGAGRTWPRAPVSPPGFGNRSRDTDEVS